MILKDRVALVTGGARRVGRAICLELARAGCDVAIHYHHSVADAQSLADEVKKLSRRAALIAGDLNNPDHWPRIIADTIAQLHCLDILINNASAFEKDNPDTIESFSADHWNAMLRTNLVAPAALVHHARPHLLAQPQGKIINLCDIAAERPWATNIAYCASKAGLVALTKSLARALAPTIQVNGVAPGIAAFPESFTQLDRDKLIARVPLNRPGTPEEVAKLIRFLVEEGDYITGQIINIDGGRSVV